MNQAADPFGLHRDRLKWAIQAAPKRVQYSYALLVRQQIAMVEDDDEVLLPGLLCLITAEAFGADADEALQTATALSLLGAMARVFDDIAAEGPAGLEREWGMPRTLNAVDAFYALAQTLVIDKETGLKPKKQLEALRLVDEACHGLSLELQSGSGPLGSLIAAGVVLGGLFANADASQTAQLRDFAQSPSAGALQSLPIGVQNALSRAIPYITRRS
jgi:hypothetical protein